MFDAELAWTKLKVALRDRANNPAPGAGPKRSWGTGELAELMADLEVECRFPEAQRGFSDAPLPHTSTDATDGADVTRRDPVASSS